MRVESGTYTKTPHRSGKVLQQNYILSVPSPIALVPQFQCGAWVTSGERIKMKKRLLAASCLVSILGSSLAINPAAAADLAARPYTKAPATAVAVYN